MCTPNRFLSGALVWFPALQCCAVIGHCCADKEARDEADRDYKWRTARDQQETYLLAALPLVQRKMETVAAARSPADEALAAFRKFRKDGGAIHQHLRNLQKQGGKLLVAEIISRKGGDGEGNDYFGPAGFRGRGAEELQTRDHDFGLIDGGLAVTNDYNPVAELERVARLLQPYSLLTTEEVALEFIVTLSDKDRKEAADALQSAEVVYRKFEVRLTDFWRFWSAANIQRLGNYGSHPENPFPIQTQHEFFEQGIRITLRHRHQECRIPFRYRDLGVSAALWPFPKPQ